MAALLVAGASRVGKATLLRGLKATPCAGKDPSAYVLRLETKYYCADLLVHCQDVHAGSVPPALDLLQAVVLVVDANSSKSFETAMSYYKSFSDHEFEIQLLVANKMDLVQQQQQQGQDSTTRPAWLEDARTWCYSNGFEYVEAAADHHGVDANLNEDGEQQGVARVLAALQAHMWPNMVQIPCQQQSSKAGAAAARGASSASCSSSCCSKDQGERAAVAAGVTAGGMGAESSREQQQSTEPVDAVPTLKQQPSSTTCQAGAVNSAGGAVSSAVGTDAGHHHRQHAAATTAVPAAEEAGDDVDPFLGVNVDDFEQLMRQVIGARARLSALGDEERRAAAADLAVKLSRMMGLGDEDDSGSEDSSSGVTQGVADDRQQQPDAVR